MDRAAASGAACGGSIPLRRISLKDAEPAVRTAENHPAAKGGFMAKDLDDKKDLVEELIDTDPVRESVEDLDQAADDLDAALSEVTDVPESEAEGSTAEEGNGNVLNDPLADSDSTEDIYSGNYRRDTSDRGIYTGGTKRDRMMSDTLGDYGEESRAERRRKRQAARRRKNIITVLICLLLAALIGCGAYAYMNGMFDKIPFLSGSSKPAETQAAETETEAPVETEPETEAPAETEPAETTPAEITWEKDQDPDISKLVSNYYLALSEGNIEEMKKALDDTTVINEEAVTNKTTFIDGYQDISTYVINGAQEGEYGVYIQYAMKFKDIETPAPGLVPAYVRLDGNGELRLLRYEDFDNDISVYMGEVSQSKQVQDLAAEVNQAFADAQAADENLKTFVEGLSGNESGTDNAGGASTATGETVAAQETQPAESTEGAGQQAGSAGNVQFKDVDDIQYVKTQVKCRKTPVIDDESEDYILVDAKTKVHVVGVSDEWCKVYLFDSKGTSGYIYKKYLTILPPDEW